MKRKNKVLLLTATVVTVAMILGWWLISSPGIEVKPLNKSPKQYGDYNLNLLPKEKQNKIYPWLIIVKKNFKGKAYVAAFPKDAVTITISGNDVYARIYTDNPDTKRLKEYML